MITSSTRSSRSAASAREHFAGGPVDFQQPFESAVGLTHRGGGRADHLEGGVVVALARSESGLARSVAGGPASPLPPSLTLSIHQAPMACHEWIATRFPYAALRPREPPRGCGTQSRPVSAWAAHCERFPSHRSLQDHKASLAYLRFVDETPLRSYGLTMFPERSARGGRLLCCAFLLRRLPMQASSAQEER